jgi:probable sporulation protein (polysaccharide deacetylase family)
LKVHFPHLRKLAVLIIAFVFIIWAVFQSPSIDQYVNTIKSENSITVDALNEDLQRKIKEWSEKKYEAPIDSRVDPIWKGIPGYNGVQIDEETSFLVAKQLGYILEENLIYEEIPIKVELSELGAVPIYKGNPNKPMVSLMINVAWGTEHLNEMLKVLAEANVKATFFLDGSWLVKNADMARKIQRDGHEIGNHGFSHPMMSRLSKDRVAEEIQRTEQAIRQHLGISSKWFAPPAGDFNQTTVDVAHTVGLKTVLWSLDTVDWKRPAPNAIVQKIVPNVHNGALILMHPTDPTKKALPILIKEIKQKGLWLGTVSENFSPHRLPHIEPSL